MFISLQFITLVSTHLAQIHQQSNHVDSLAKLITSVNTQCFVVMICCFLTLTLKTQAVAQIAFRLCYLKIVTVNTMDFQLDIKCIPT